MAPRSHLQSHALIIVLPSRLLLPQVAVSLPPHPHDTNLTKPCVSLGSFRPRCRSLCPTTEADPARLWLITLCPTGSGEVIDMPRCVAAVGSFKKKTKQYMLNFHWQKSSVAYSLTRVRWSQWHLIQSQTIQHCCWLFILKTPPVPSRMSTLRCVKDRCVRLILYK